MHFQRLWVLGDALLANPEIVENCRLRNVHGYGVLRKAFDLSLSRDVSGQVNLENPELLYNVSKGIRKRMMFTLRTPEMSSITNTKPKRSQSESNSLVQGDFRVKCQSLLSFCARMRWYGPEMCIGNHCPVYAWSTVAWFAIAPLMMTSGP